MPEVKSRSKKEQTIAQRLWSTWNTWSGVDSPAQLTAGSLIALLRKNLTDILSSIWQNGYMRLAAMFTGFRLGKRMLLKFLMWIDDRFGGLAKRWMRRVTDYILDQESANPTKSEWEFVRQEGKAVAERIKDKIEELESQEVELGETIKRPMQSRFGIRGNKPEAKDAPEPEAEPLDSKPLVEKFDALREAIDLVTDANTHGELTAKTDIESQGIARLTAIWNTEDDPCKRCAKLSGQPERVWRVAAPDGPKLHPNCVLPMAEVRPFTRFCAAMRTWYEGPAVEILTSNDNYVQLTWNHNVPTPLGEVPAHKLRIGDDVFVYNDEVDHVKAEALFNEFEGEFVTTTGDPSMFHGDGSEESLVDIVSIDRLDDRDMMTVRDLLDSEVLKVARIEQVTHFQYSGMVYDFSADSLPYYSAGGIAVHNCRCWLEFYPLLQAPERVSEASRRA